MIASIDYPFTGINYANIENVTLVDNTLRVTGNAQNNILDGRKGDDRILIPYDS